RAPHELMPFALCASIVVFESDPALLARTLEALDRAIADAEAARLIGASEVVLVENDAPPAADDAAGADGPLTPPFVARSRARRTRRPGQGHAPFSPRHN